MLYVCIINSSSFILSLILDISIAPLQVHYYSEAAPDYSIDTVLELTHRSITGNYKTVKDLPKVPMWRLEWNSNVRPSEHRAPNLPLSNHHLTT